MALGSGQTHILTDSDVNTYIASLFSSQVEAKAISSTGYDMSGFLIDYHHLPVIEIPYGSI